jgi:surfactin synthase thioesterase subunit
MHVRRKRLTTRNFASKERHLKAPAEPLIKTLPTLSIVASRDRLVSRHASKTLSAFTHASVVQIDGPHFLLQVRPRAVLDAITQRQKALQPST